MIYEASKQIHEFARELESKVFEVQENSVVSIEVGTDSFSLDLWFISSDDDTDVSLRVIPFIKGRQENRDAIINTCNELNCKFRYAKFVVDSDGDVCMMADFPENLPMSKVGPVALEYVSRFLSIAKEAYPELMKTIWA